MGRWRPVTLTGGWALSLITRGSFLGLHPESLAQIELTTDRIVDEKILRPLAFHSPFENEISAIHDAQGLAHIVVGDQYRQAGFAQVNHNLLNVIDGDGINAAERLI